MCVHVVGGVMHVFMHVCYRNIKECRQRQVFIPTTYGTLPRVPVITEGAVNTVPEEFLRKWAEVQDFLFHCVSQCGGPHLLLRAVLSLADQSKRTLQHCTSHNPASTLSRFNCNGQARARVSLISFLVLLNTRSFTRSFDLPSSRHAAWRKILSGPFQ